MTTMNETETNLNWIGKVDDAWHEVLKEVLQRGYHGTASLELSIVDGTIHRVMRSVTRIEK